MIFFDLNYLNAQCTYKYLPNMFYVLGGIQRNTFSQHVLKTRYGLLSIGQTWKNCFNYCIQDCRSQISNLSPLSGFAYQPPTSMFLLQNIICTYVVKFDLGDKKNILKPNFFKKQNFSSSFFLPRVMIEVQNGLEFSAGQFYAFRR